MTDRFSTAQMQDLMQNIRAKARQLGFDRLGISDVNLEKAEQHLHTWLENQHHGSMQYMAEHGNKRSRPQELVPGTLRIISVRLNYLPQSQDAKSVLDDSDKAYVSRYALGRDYHKLMRKRLATLANDIRDLVGEFDSRAFVDSAPVLEKAIAEKAGLGWIGKHSNLLSRDAGSFFFLGELFTNLPLPLDDEQSDFHCGSCDACITACPTDAIVAPFQVDARRCISYLTIEHKGAIPVEFRQAMGNRIYGCDDCQLFCPWNRFAKMTKETDFSPRHDLDDADLLELFHWDEDTFLRNTEGSAIRRIGHAKWISNIAIALGNTTKSDAIVSALLKQQDHESEMVREHIDWALTQHGIKS
jgi:epoxyqueuosine reductase